MRHSLLRRFAHVALSVVKGSGFPHLSSSAVPFLELSDLERWEKDKRPRQSSSNNLPTARFVEQSREAY